MSVRSLNKVMLIGNLTRDPELRYTPNGTAVCSFGIATNRSWTTEGGEKKEETEFHRVVAWSKLAELCSQLLSKGRKVFVEGRLQTRSWQSQDGLQRSSTEIVIDDMIILDPKRPVGNEGMTAQAVSGSVAPVPAAIANPPSAADEQTGAADSPPANPLSGQGQASTTVSVAQDSPDPVAKSSRKSKLKTANEDINPDEIPF